jgi:hypothetical protein
MPTPRLRWISAMGTLIGTDVLTMRRQARERRKRQAEDAEFGWIAQNIPPQVIVAVLNAVNANSEAPLQALPPALRARVIRAFRQTAGSAD